MKPSESRLAVSHMRVDTGEWKSGKFSLQREAIAGNLEMAYLVHVTVL